jgi:hypothetical protein
MLSDNKIVYIYMYLFKNLIYRSIIIDKRISWYKDDINFLKNNIGKISYLEMSKHLGKPVSSISSKIYDLGISIRKSKRWKNEEIEFLINNYHKIGVEECALILNKTKNSVWKKASIIGLSHNNNVKYELIEEISGPNSKLWLGCGEISGAYFYNIKNNAIKRRLDFDLTIEYIWSLFLKQNKKCALSGVDIGFSKKNIDKHKTTASLDRIDSSKGYIIENTQWVHKEINRMKMDLNENEFIYWCNLIAKHRREI